MPLILWHANLCNQACLSVCQGNHACISMQPPHSYDCSILLLCMSLYLVMPSLRLLAKVFTVQWPFAGIINLIREAACAGDAARPMACASCHQHLFPLLAVCGSLGSIQWDDRLYPVHMHIKADRQDHPQKGRLPTLQGQQWRLIIGMQMVLHCCKL